MSVGVPDDILAHTSLSILYQKKRMVPEAEAEGNKARVLGVEAAVEEGEWMMEASPRLLRKKPRSRKMARILGTEAQLSSAI